MNTCSWLGTKDSSPTLIVSAENVKKIESRDDKIERLANERTQAINSIGENIASAIRNQVTLTQNNSIDAFYILAEAIHDLAAAMRETRKVSELST